LKRWYIVASIVFFLGGASWTFLEAGGFLAAPSSDPSHADLIIALGGDNGARVLLAAKLWKKGIASHILLTGLEEQPIKTRNQYLNWRVKFLTVQNIPKDAIMFDIHSRNSFEEALNTFQLMQKHHWESALVISDPPHMRRLNWVWSNTFNSTGMEYILVQTHPAWWDEDHWWANEASAQFVLMEYIKFAYYVFQYGV